MEITLSGQSVLRAAAASLPAMPRLGTVRRPSSAQAAPAADSATEIEQDCFIAGHPGRAADFIARGLTPAQARQELLAEAEAAKPGGLARAMRQTLHARGVAPSDEKPTSTSTRGYHHRQTTGGGPRLRQVDSMRAFLKARGIIPAEET